MKILFLFIGAVVGALIGVVVASLCQAASGADEARESITVSFGENDKTILIDMDDTIEDLLPAWVEYLNNKYGTSVDYREIDSWDVCSYFPTIEDEDVYNALKDEALWDAVKPKEGAAEYIEKLIQEGFNIYLCTTSNKDTIKVKFDCVIKRYFPFITWDKVIVIDDKSMIKADCLVDDGLHNLIFGDYEKILFTAGHNKNIDPKAYGLHRAFNWGEVYQLIHELFPSEA